MRGVLLWGTGALVYSVIAVTSCGEPFGSKSGTTASGAESVTTTTPSGTGSGSTTSTGGATGSGVGGAGAGSTTSTGAGAGNTTTGTSTGVGGTGPSSLCDERFGMLTDYQLCGDSLAECKFEVRLFGQSCMQTCYQGGVDCEDASAPFPVGSCNSSGGLLACHIARTSATVCTCLKACHGGPPCEVGDVCSATGCLEATQ